MYKDKENDKAEKKKKKKETTQNTGAALAHEAMKCPLCRLDVGDSEEAARLHDA